MVRYFHLALKKVSCESVSRGQSLALLLISVCASPGKAFLVEAGDKHLDFQNKETINESRLPKYYGREIPLRNG